MKLIASGLAMALLYVALVMGWPMVAMFATAGLAVIGTSDKYPPERHP